MNVTIEEILNEVEQKINPRCKEIQAIEYQNQKKVLQAFRNQQISETDFQATTGYGYDDIGREKLEAVYADVFGGEDALVRPQLASGTHAISTALFGVLRLVMNYFT